LGVWLSLTSENLTPQSALLIQQLLCVGLRQNATQNIVANEPEVQVVFLLPGNFSYQDFLSQGFQRWKECFISHLDLAKRMIPLKAFLDITTPSFSQ
jgi:hypothetical protein